MKRLIVWIVIKALFVALFWYGAVDGVQGAANVTIFWVWVSSFLTVLTYVNRTLRKAARLRGRTVPASIERSFDLLILFALTWMGWWITAVVWLVGPIWFENLILCDPDIAAAVRRAEGDAEE